MRNRIKILIVFVGCLLFRLSPLRAPNLEPIMASIMPLGKKYGGIVAFTFGFLSMVLYDVLTARVGFWTWTTAFSYGIIGLISVFYFKKYKTSALYFAIFAFIGTIFFDLVTGILFAPMFGQTMLNAFVLQIPFTILHLAGNVCFALTLSPILNRWLVSEKFFVLERRVRIVV